MKNVDIQISDLISSTDAKLSPVHNLVQKFITCTTNEEQEEIKQIIKFLVTKGADINKISGDFCGKKFAPIDFAIKKGSLSLVTFLTEMPGIVINGRPSGYNPLENAVSDAIKNKNYGDNNSYNNSLAIIKQLVKSGAENKWVIGDLRKSLHQDIFNLVATEKDKSFALPSKEAIAKFANLTLEDIAEIKEGIRGSVEVNFGKHLSGEDFIPVISNKLRAEKIDVLSNMRNDFGHPASFSIESNDLPKFFNMLNIYENRKESEGKPSTTLTNTTIEKAIEQEKQVTK